MLINRSPYQSFLWDLTGYNPEGSFSISIRLRILTTNIEIVGILLFLILI